MLSEKYQLKLNIGTCELLGKYVKDSWREFIKEYPDWRERTGLDFVLFCQSKNAEAIHKLMADLAELEATKNA